MIAEYEFTLADEIRNAKQLVCYLYRKLLVPSIVTAAMGVVILVLALTMFTEEKAFLTLGCALLVIAAIVVCMFVFVYILSVKNTKKAFGMYSVDGKEKFTIEYTEGVYTFCNLSKGNVAKYAATDIVSVMPYKNLLVLKLVSKQIAICPDDINTRQLFSDYLSSK